ncbi:ABC transporter transmembrane domain-containing protein [Silanimonas sp.]|uniref:ABC transporter transmembrane domain-containing protein n=1 Tax=Silanimonas sp. TaxID=1929290 RepID=UPI001BBC9067|nr:ABC transporter transmembrane domain-containing protein [Silanimonas sp.]MBS3897022.1 ATP-binding cassette domain-containing protein [Silanimonas sp.]
MSTPAPTLATEPRGAETVTPRQRLNSLRGLLPFLAPHRRLLAAWFGALALSSAATLSLPVAVRHMIDQGFSAGGDIDRWFLLMFGVALLLAFATALRFYFVSILGERVLADLRGRLYRHLLALDQRFYDRSRSTELMSRLSADTELLRSVVGSSMSVALRSVVIVVGSLVMLVVTSPTLASLAVIGIPLAVLPIVLGGRLVRKASEQTQDRVAEANARAGETLGAMHTVQSYAREAHESRRFDAALRSTQQAAAHRIRIQAMLTAVAIVLFFGAIVLVLWSGAQAVIEGRMSAGALGQFMLYALIGAGSVGALAEVWSEVQRAGGGMQRIADLFAESPVVAAPADPLPLPVPVRGAIRFEGVRFAYPSRPTDPALLDFNLDVRPGETVALVGPSGAGKSTVLQLLLRFHDPQQGRITLDGIDLRALDPAALRGSIALVPQDPMIFAASAAENIRYGRLEASDAEVERAAALAEADEFIRTLPQGYASELGERGARLSGGQQQRIAIARALLKDAPLLLLDEATSALDAQSEHLIQQALEQLMRGRTTLVIAHRLATVLKADRIVVLDGGRIVDAGSHAELLAKGGLYTELARLQFAAPAAAAAPAVPVP